MPLSYTSTNAKEAAKPVTIIVEFPCCPSQARSWLDFYSIALSHTSRKASYLRASVASGKNAELSTWYLLLDFYPTFIDLTKAFDTVSGEGLWRIIAKYGCPSKFIAIVHQLHDGMLARVQDNGETSDPFPVTNGVKQGCILAPTLFSHCVFSHADRCLQ